MSEPRKRGRPSKADLEARAAEAEALNARIYAAESGVKSSHPLDRDHDGEPGGSLKNNPLQPTEMQAIKEDFLDAYDMQDELSRHDSKSRRWAFRPDVIQPDNKACMLVELRMSMTVREYRIGNDRLGIDAGMAELEEGLDTLSRVVQ